MRKKIINMVPGSWMNDIINDEVEKINSKLKNCINCHKSHRHNNAFCSADCCKKFSAKELSK